MMDGMGFCWFLLPLLFRVDMTPSLVCGGIQYHDIPGTGFSEFELFLLPHVLRLQPHVLAERVREPGCILQMRAGAGFDRVGGVQPTVGLDGDVGDACEGCEPGGADEDEDRFGDVAFIRLRRNTPCFSYGDIRRLCLTSPYASL